MIISPQTNDKYSYEKIVFFLDMDLEMNGLEFCSKKKEKKTRLDYIKEGIKSITRLKRGMSTKHQFAVALLTTEALWTVDFTSDYDSFVDKINEYQPVTSFSSLDFTSIYHEINSRVSQVSYTTEGVPYSLRAIFIYSRSTVMPEFKDSKDKEGFTQLLKSGNFTFDCLYLHNKIKDKEKDKPQDIFNFLADICPAHSLMFENSTNLKKLYQQLCSLAYHPHQRPTDENIKPYSIK